MNHNIQLLNFFKKIPLPGGIKLWLTLISIIFLISSIIDNADELANIPFKEQSYILLLLSLTFCSFSLLINAYAWEFLLFWLGSKPRDINIITLYLRTNLLKYLPGGIWHFVERLRILRNHVQPGTAIYAVLLEPFLMVSGAMICVCLAGWQSGLLLLCMIPPLAFIESFREPFFRLIRNLKIKSFQNKIDLGFNQFPVDLGKPKGYPFRPLLLEVSFIFFRFISFWICLAIFDIGFTLDLLNWLSIFSIAWIIGLIVPGAPGGIGIFESTLLLRVGELVSEPELIASLLCYRLICMIADIIVVGFTSKRCNLISYFN